MPQVFLQPASGAPARQHYRDTVENPVPVARLNERLSPAQSDALRGVLAGRSAVQIWGLRAGADGRGERGWNMLNSGDIGLFARTGRYFSRCRLIGKVHSVNLSNELWPQPQGGRPFEYAYFIDAVRAIDIPYETFNAAIGAAPNRVPLGFAILRPGQAAAAINAFRLAAP